MNNCDIGVIEPSVLSYKWEVHHFSTKKAGVASYLLSPIFSTKHTDGTVQWRLWLYPNENEDHLSIYIEHIGRKPVQARVTFFIVNVENKIIFQCAMRNKLFTIPSQPWGLPQFIERKFILDPQNHVLESDTLKIYCEINFNSMPIVEESFTIIDQITADEEHKVPNNRLKEFDDFGKLLESEAFSDMTFIVDEKKIHAHKAILVSRSPVFEVILHRYTKESQENILEISGIKYEIMKELLRFMYVGRVNDIDQQAADLLIAADKYSISGLKALCEDILCKNLSIDNVLEYLNLAAVCDATILKSQVIEFIASNLEDVVEKPEFELFGDLNSTVICEVVRAIAKKNSKK